MFAATLPGWLLADIAGDLLAHGEILAGGGAGVARYGGGNGAVRRLRFLEAVTVTTLSSHRIIPPFGVHGGAPGATGRDWAELPDGSKVDLPGNAEIELEAGSVFVIHTPGGGGWGTA